MRTNSLSHSINIASFENVNMQLKHQRCVLGPASMLQRSVAIVHTPGTLIITGSITGISLYDNLHHFFLYNFDTLFSLQTTGTMPSHTGVSDTVISHNEGSGQEQRALPEVHRSISLATRLLCFLAFGNPSFDNHYISLQSDEAFEASRNKLITILATTFGAASVLLAANIALLSVGSPAPWFDYTTIGSYSSLFVSLMLAMIATITSASSTIRWQYIDRRWIQEQLQQSGYFIFSYLLSIVMPTLLVFSSLNSFILGELLRYLVFL
ncbi:uncharacterized protein EDB93DRAFT_649127 [Suillus bovinus]|uniref:uncharacterized protein n=1 Tax=Suillus bovinus TaxID=48563 RepID=UPI001B85F67B|nr:uncharacterized protein EDB93DRAFT_649127 [Suillus bovinus]KAG2140940.1 hypothetical protein EDB93DRAFT_649127 [Suillus bovinus]